MLSFSAVTLRRGPRLLLSDVTFSIFRGEKVAIVGANGTGKSSLLSVVLGELQPDSGSFDMPRNLAVAHVAQELSSTERPAIEFVLDGDAELRVTEAAMLEAERTNDGAHLGELHARYAALGGYDARSRAGKLMHGLGFDATDESRALAEFSGGWRVRLNLAQALMCRSDLLLLDEPTNHLDLDAVLWLEQWLREYPGTLLLIAHDREFLDRIANRVVHLEHGEAHIYAGNYTQFEVQRAEQLAQQQSLYDRQQREIRHMTDFIDRFRAQATKARQAQSRVKALERMQRIAPAHVDSPFEFSFRDPEKLPRPLLTLERQNVGYTDRPIVERVNLTITPGQRLALLGRNGAGKSTVMKLLAGELQGTSGRTTAARDLRIGYFAQHQLEQLTLDDSPFEQLRRLDRELGGRTSEQEVRDFLASFGFRGERVFEPVGPFSGGEKARLVLALVSYRRPNLMLLDEPTNHLDLEMRQALAMALQEFTGAVVLVSHDRHLLRMCADEFLLVANGVAVPFDGDLDDYAQWLARDQSSDRTPDGNANGNSAQDRAERKRTEAARRNRLSPLRKQIAGIEADITRLESARATTERELTDPALYENRDKSRLHTLLAEQARRAKELERCENQWLALTEQLEAAQLQD
jgi:ATP-binding cassette, subfamily F, member 3